MKSGGALLLIIVGLFALWLVVTGRWANVQTALTGALSNTSTTSAPASSTPGSTPSTTNTVANPNGTGSAAGGATVSNVVNAVSPVVTPSSTTVSGQYTPVLPSASYTVAHHAVAQS